jgi:hypothetical protein
VVALAVGQPHQGENTTRFSRQTEGIDALEVYRAVFHLYPNSLKAHLGYQTGQQSRSTVDGDTANPARIALSIYKYIVFGCDDKPPYL